VADTWNFAFRVSETQDKDARYEQVRGIANIPPTCEDDVTEAHDQVWDNFTTNGEPTKPYAVYLSGWREGEEYQITTHVELNA
jgi:hypothetical protein